MNRGALARWGACGRRPVRSMPRKAHGSWHNKLMRILETRQNLFILDLRIRLVISALFSHQPSEGWCRAGGVCSQRNLAGRRALRIRVVCGEAAAWRLATPHASIFRTHDNDSSSFAQWASRVATEKEQENGFGAED